MDLILTRKQFREDGIFGELKDAGGALVAVTLEHAYPSGEYFVSKIPPGTYICQRGEHQLEHMAQPFTTFEITGVEGHTNLLFHTGNFNHDSNGCVLLGTGIAPLAGGGQMIMSSRTAFQKFMDLEAELMLFHLLVIGWPARLTLVDPAS